MPDKNAREIAEALGGAKTSGDGWVARCPAHDDRNPSLSITEQGGRILFHCFAGCTQEDVIDALKARGLWSPTPSKPPKGPALPPGVRRKWYGKPYQAHWVYRDAEGKEIGFVVRYESHEGKELIPFFKKNGSKWKAKAPQPPRPLYNLHLLAKHPDAPVIVTEGEKAAEAAARLFPGHVVTTCQGGAKAPGKTDWKPLNGREVIVWPDNDEAGLDFAMRVKGLVLKAGAARVRVLDPVALGMSRKEDAADWPPDRALPDPLPDLVEEDHGDAADLRDRPHIYAGEGDLAVLVNRGWEVLLAANDPPSLFVHNDVVTLVDRSGRVLPVSEKALRVHLSDVAFFFDLKGPEEDRMKVPARPPRILVESLLHAFHKPLPVLRRVIHHPVFTRDGTLHAVRGFDPSSGFYMAWPEDLPLPTAPGNPTREDVRRAVDAILDVLADFPFRGDPDRANAVALMILPTVREMIDGPTPLHLIEAPTYGTGKTFLAETCAAPAGEAAVASITEGRDDDEWRKRITSALLQGAEIVLVDNVNRRLESGPLSSAVTARIWTDRLLGQSRNVSTPVSCVWVATGNNVVTSGEISRRCVPIRLVSKTEEPWRRPPEGFRHPDLRAFLKANRVAITSAILTLVRAWIAAGKPTWKGRPLGSFEEWSRVVGGILDVAGIEGFMGNLDEFYARADFEGAYMRPFVEAWWDAHRSNAVGVKDLFELIESKDIEMPLGDGSDRSKRTKLGMLLSRSRDRIFGRFAIVPGPVSRRAQTWRLSPLIEAVRVSGEPCEPSITFSGSDTQATDLGGGCGEPWSQGSHTGSPTRTRMNPIKGEPCEPSITFSRVSPTRGELSDDNNIKDAEKVAVGPQGSPNLANMRICGGEPSVNLEPGRPKGSPSAGSPTCRTCSLFRLAGSGGGICGADRPPRGRFIDPDSEACAEYMPKGAGPGILPGHAG